MAWRVRARPGCTRRDSSGRYVAVVVEDIPAAGREVIELLLTGTGVETIQHVLVVGNALGGIAHGGSDDFGQLQGPIAFQQGDEGVNDPGQGEGERGVHTGAGGDAPVAAGQVEIGGGLSRERCPARRGTAVSPLAES